MSEEKNNSVLRANYTSKTVNINEEGKYNVVSKDHKISVLPKHGERLGVMLVGWGGNNGTTLTTLLDLHRRKATWESKHGTQSAEKLLGSISQCGSVHIGYDKYGLPHSELFKNMLDLYDPRNIVIGGWDISNDNLYKATRKAGVIEPSILTAETVEYLSNLTPLPSIYDPSFIATNQKTRVKNIISTSSKQEQISRIVSDIVKFRSVNSLDRVVVLWTASTERFHNGTWANYAELLQAIKMNDTEVSPSVLFAVASARAKCIFLNGSPQNTICPAVIDCAKVNHTFVGGEDFKTGQTKLKSALADWLVSSGIKPLSIVSYNHLGNNDGCNLKEKAQFRSKEITKKNVIDDVVDENPYLFNGRTPDHAVVIKYVPAVGDSKRAMDEYYSELALGGRHNLVIHNTCEDSLLAAPLMLDIILFAEFFARVRIQTGEEKQSFKPILSMLSFFFKAPVVNDNEPLINAFFRQRYGLENFTRVINGLPTMDFLHLPYRI